MTWRALGFCKIALVACWHQALTICVQLGQAEAYMYIVALNWFLL